MRRKIILVAVLACAAVGLYVFRIEISSIAFIAKVKLTQVQVCRLMKSAELIEQCIVLVDRHEGKPRLIVSADFSDSGLSLPRSVLDKNPSWCMVTTNSLAFTWNVLPRCFWSASVSKDPVDEDAVMAELGSAGPTAQLDFKVVGSGDQWIVLQSFN